MFSDNCMLRGAQVYEEIGNPSCMRVFPCLKRKTSSVNLDGSYQYH